jgi:hypothetical protein
MPSEIDWEYGQKYNDEGEFNPRLVACNYCGEYYEPDYLDDCEKSNA